MNRFEIYTPCSKSVKAICDRFNAECRVYNLNDESEMFYLQFESKLSHEQMISMMDKFYLEWEQITSRKL